jgi:hypothetical protein
MRRFLLIFYISFIAFVVPTSAQLFYTGTEYGIGLGASQYFGDLNDNYGFKFIRPAGDVFIRKQLNPYIAIKGSIGYTLVGYNDSYNNNVYEQERNLSFRSSVAEGVLQAEFNFFRFATGESNSRFTPYLTGGLGVFYYNPYTTYDGRKYYLRELGTEGQYAGGAKKYSDFAMCFPVGVGIKYWIRPGMNLGFEIADRLTTTDYLDDVSGTYAGPNKFPNDPQNPNPAYILQNRTTATNTTLGEAGKQRGDSSSKDQYMMGIITLSFQFKQYRCPGYLKRGL